MDKIVPHEQEPMCLLFMEELGMNQAIKSLDLGHATPKFASFPDIMYEEGFDDTFTKTCGFMHRLDGLDTSVPCEEKLEHLRDVAQNHTTRLEHLAFACEALGAPLAIPNDPTQQPRLPVHGAITTRAILHGEFKKAQHFRHGLIDKNGQRFKESERKLYNLKAGCVSIMPMWHDSWGDNCGWYEDGTGSRCETYGHTFRARGMVANENCCVW